MPRVALIVTALILTASLIARGQRQYTVYGLGLKSCGDWVKTTDSTSLAQQAARLALGAWISGFLTAANFYTDREIRKTNPAGIEVWMDEYCRRHPLTELNDASRALVADLVGPR